MMQATQFKDVKGDVWTLSINIKTYLTIKQKFGIDISDVFSKNNNWLAQLAAQDDLMNLIGILLEITKATRDEKAITEDAFYELLDGDTIEAATSAFIEAVVLFLPAHKQTAMRTVMAAVQLGIEKTQETMEASKDRLVEKVSQTMNEEAAKVLKELTE